METIGRSWPAQPLHIAISTASSAFFFGGGLGHLVRPKRQLRAQRTCRHAPRRYPTPSFGIVRHANGATVLHPGWCSFFALVAPWPDGEECRRVFSVEGSSAHKSRGATAPALEDVACARPRPHEHGTMGALMRLWCARAREHGAGTTRHRPLPATGKILRRDCITLMPSARRERRHASGNSNTLQVSRRAPRSPCCCSDLLPCLMCWARAAGAAPRARQACGRAGGPFRRLLSSHRKWSSTASHLDGPPTLALPPDGERAQLFCKY